MPALPRRVALVSTPVVVAAVAALSLAGTGAAPAAHAAKPAAHPGAVQQHQAVPRSAPASPAVVSAVTTAFSKAFKRVPGHVEGYADVLSADGTIANVLDHRGESIQAPASTTKLFTSGTALLTMGKNYRFSTAVVRTGSDGSSADLQSSAILPDPTDSPTPGPSASASASPTASASATATASATPSATPTTVYFAADKNGTMHGDLELVGAGDPSFGSGDLLALAKAVRKAGIKKIQGGVYLDDRYLDQVRGAVGWKSDYVGGESGVLSGLMVDSNLRSGSASYKKNPSPYNLALFMGDLAKAGVKVTGKAQVGISPHPVTSTVAKHDSATLASIIGNMDRNSINTWAEELLKDIGAYVKGVGSTNAGLSVVRATAASFGLTISTLADGSGLSMRDRMTAQQEVSWLEAMDTTAAGPVLRNALAVSCTSGTLAGRLCGAYLTGRVHAKTGTLDHTANLAGWVTTRAGDTVYFSLLADQTSDNAARAAIDSVVAGLARSNY